LDGFNRRRKAASLTTLRAGPPRPEGGWDQLVQAPFSVYLHGTLVTPEYPKRTP